MSNIAYILNLTESFNANNFLYYFLPGISSGKILLFDDLTKATIVACKKKEEIETKLQALKDHWDLYRLNPKNSYDKLKVNVVLDLEEWSFLNCGIYSRLPALKIKYLKSILNSHFNANVIFQYFILCDAASALENEIKNIDINKGYAVKSVKKLTWAKVRTINSLLNREFKIQQRDRSVIATENILGVLKQEFQQWVDQLVTKIKDEFNIVEGSGFDIFLGKKLNELRDEFSKTIITNEDLSIEKRKVCVNHFFEKLSLSYYLNKGINSDLAFWYPLDKKDIASTIRCFEALSAVLVESVDFFGMADKFLDFITSNGDKQVISIKNIKFNDKQTNHLFEMYKSFSQDKFNKDDIYNKKESIKQFAFYKELSVKELFDLDRSKENHFITISNLKRKIPLFFSKDKVSFFQECFRDNNMDELEDRIKIQSSRTADVTNLNDGNKLAHNTIKLSLKEIEAEINKLKDEEKKTSIKSNVDLEKYDKAKGNYLSKKNELISEFFNKFNLLPKQPTVLGFLILFFTSLFLFLGSLYRFIYWVEARISSAIITTILCLTTIVILCYFQRKVLSIVEEIRLENIAIYNSFKSYVSSLKEIAVAIRESTLRRKNIHELEKTKESIDSEMQKQFAYSKFYKDIIYQLDKNGKMIKMVSEKHWKHWNEQGIDYLNPPYKDKRVANIKFNEKKLVVEAGSTNKKDFSNETNFNPLLNVIELIEIN
ncbi:MAG TPA: hypothetical protein PK978_00270 [Paludibacter sp.]|nr:hypothetical protein [Paludibacter sp.]